MNCKGQYLQRVNDGAQEVIALCDGGTLRAFTKEQYIENNLEPQIGDLPDKKSYQAQQTNDVSPIILGLLDWTKGKLINSEMIYRLQQFSFIFPDNNGVLRITSAGKQALESNGLS